MEGKSGNGCRIDDLVSIVMPLYNQRAFLTEAIDSVLHQIYQNWELIIVDDASTDGSLEVARIFERNDPRIHIISLPINRGVSCARNVGISEARGNFLAFLDSDDVWLPQKLTVQMKFMKLHSAALSFSQYRRFTEDGLIGVLVQIPDRVTYEKLLKGNVIGCSTTMIDRKQVGEVVMQSVRHEDYAAWLDVLKRGHVAFGIQEDLARYRISRRSVSGDKMRSAAWTWRIYRHVEKLTVPKSLWCFGNYFLRAVRARLMEWTHYRLLQPESREYRGF